jgi:hypothetical protein
MARRRELLEFVQDMTVGVRQMGHSVSKVVLIFNIPRSTVSHVYLEYLMEGISTHRERVLDDRDQRHRARIVRGNRQAEGARGSVVVKALCCKPEGRGFTSR